jgi:hypothetical protein
MYCEVCFSAWPADEAEYTLEKIAENVTCCHRPTDASVRLGRMAHLHGAGNPPPPEPNEPQQPRQSLALQDRLGDAQHPALAPRGAVPPPPPGLVQGLRESPAQALLQARVVELEARLGRAERSILDQSDLEDRVLRAETLLKKVCDTLVMDAQ